MEEDGVTSEVDVCVVLVNGTIAPGVLVNYSIVYDDMTPTSQG